MSPKRKINLLPQGRFEYSTTGKFLTWAVSVGRWIVVFTELIVICAFLSRFYFDTQLANLFDDIKQKKAIVASTAEFEDNFRQIQDKIKIIKNLLAGERKPSTLIADISRLLPIDVSLTSIDIEGKDLSFNGYSLSEGGLQGFWLGLTQHPKISQVTLSDISSRKEGLPGLSFRISAVIE